MSRAQRSSLWLAGAALVALCAPAAAQDIRIPPSFGSGANAVYREDPASALARYLRVITAKPRDLEALTGAGRAALEVGDPQAAIGFYARAEAIAPRNGRIKAGLGSALVLMNQQQAALKYFDEATALGVPEADIASDRGLAYDLRGSGKRAQHDYAIALSRGGDPETTRRMALSLAIGGERDAALKLLDPLLRRQDTAAWRARAFILAMTGDTAGASRAAESVMPASTAAGFVPFFRKLPSLRAGEKAAAVHFGLFPGEGRPMRIDDLFNQAEVAARVALENAPRSPTDAGSIDATQGALGRLASRTPDAEGQLSARLAARPPTQPRVVPVSTPRPNAVHPSVTRTLPKVAAGAPPKPTTSASSALRTTEPTTSTIPSARPTSKSSPSASPGPVAALPVAVTAAPAPAPVITASPSATNGASTGPSTTQASGPAPAPVPGFSATGTPAFPPPQPAPLPAAPTPTRLADVSATVREAASEPLVRAVELPPSSAPALPSGGDASATGTPAPAQRLADLGRMLGQTPAAQEGPPPAPSAAAVPSTGMSGPPPAPRPKVETSAPRPEVSSSAPPPASKPKVEVAAAAKPKVEPSRPKVEASKPKVEAAAKPPAAKADAKTGDAARIWVQVAGGADEKAFSAEWKRLKAKAPELLSAQTPWTTPLKATNRLLVGPFATDKEAQEFVNKLKPKGITAFAWTSEKGQAIAKVAAR